MLTKRPYTDFSPLHLDGYRLRAPAADSKCWAFSWGCEMMATFSIQLYKNLWYVHWPCKFNRNVLIAMSSLKISEVRVSHLIDWKWFKFSEGPMSNQTTTPKHWHDKCMFRHAFIWYGWLDLEVLSESKMRKKWILLFSFTYLLVNIHFYLHTMPTNSPGTCRQTVVRKTYTVTKV